MTYVFQGKSCLQNVVGIQNIFRRNSSKLNSFKIISVQLQKELRWKAAKNPKKHFIDKVFGETSPLHLLGKQYIFEGIDSSNF